METTGKAIIIGVIISAIITGIVLVILDDELCLTCENPEILLTDVSDVTPEDIPNWAMTVMACDMPMLQYVAKYTTLYENEDLIFFKDISLPEGVGQAEYEECFDRLHIQRQIQIDANKPVYFDEDLQKVLDACEKSEIEELFEYFNGTHFINNRICYWKIHTNFWNECIDGTFGQPQVDPEQPDKCVTDAGYVLNDSPYQMHWSQDETIQQDYNIIQKKSVLL